MFNIRTDLALEAKEIYENDQKSTEIPGVKVKNKDLEKIHKESKEVCIYENCHHYRCICRSG